MPLLPLRHSTLSHAVKRTLALKNARIKILSARVVVLTEDLEIAEFTAGKAEESAAHWEDRFVKIVETATVVRELKEAAEAKLKEKDESERVAVRRMNEAEDWAHREAKRADAAEDKLKEIAKLVDSDWNNGTIPHSYELTAAVRRILK